VPPPGTDRVDIAEREIRQWMETYREAYQALDASRVKAMNPASTFRPAQYNSASVTFSNVDIRPREDGQSAVLHADVQYQYGFKRGVAPPPPSMRVAWRMHKTPSGWQVQP
jgi:ketosteroid isomerase-like protein